MSPEMPHQQGDEAQYSLQTTRNVGTVQEAATEVVRHFPPEGACSRHGWIHRGVAIASCRKRRVFGAGGASRLTEGHRTPPMSRDRTDVLHGILGLLGDAGSERDLLTNPGRRRDLVVESVGWSGGIQRPRSRGRWTMADETSNLVDGEGESWGDDPINARPSSSYPELGGAFTPLYQRSNELGVASRMVEVGRIGPRGRSADFAVDDPDKFVSALRAAGPAVAARWSRAQRSLPVLSCPGGGPLLAATIFEDLPAEISEDAAATVGDDLVVGAPLIGTSRSKNLRDLRDRRSAAVGGSRVGRWSRSSIQAVPAAAEQELHAWGCAGYGQVRVAMTGPGQRHRPSR
jgi:hypothetical protein